MSDGAQRAHEAAEISATSGTAVRPHAIRPLQQHASDPPMNVAQVEVRRSERRRKTVSARREGDRIIVLVPSGLPLAAEAEVVDRMISKLEKADQRRTLGKDVSDERLFDRAMLLSRRWLDGSAVPTRVEWVPAMRTRWASCTPDDGTIRVSNLLQAVPEYVLDYVLVHELAHLVIPGGHPPEFWELVDRFPRTERAIGFLEAYSRMNTTPTAQHSTATN
ncbi:M48 metallopeptidase family protein [Hoyosella rhizosphaerae]|nr:M48 family metallopeptidase [Hoyosella rhizosphaerae]